MSAHPHPLVCLDPIETLDCDAFELGLLPLARHFLSSLQNPDRSGWQHALAIAVENWSESPGLSIAHNFQIFLSVMTRGLGRRFEYQDPLCPDARLFVTPDERTLLQMIHHMRRDQTGASRHDVDELTGGRMDPDLIRAALTFAARFPSGEKRPSNKAVLRVVAAN